VSAPGTPISVVLADDHPVVLRGLHDLLARDTRFAVVACSDNGIECLDELRRHTPDVALVDIAMPGMSGMQVLAQAAVEKLPTRVVLLTASRDDRNLATAASSGAYGILLKDASAEEMIHCLYEVHAGRKHLPHALLQSAVTREQARLASERKINEALTDRERELAFLIADGKSNKELAAQLRLSEGTVKVHLHNIYQKLEVKSRVALVALVHSVRGR
jgi:two-component system, NarL family, nitrate/nitrite response regulator NarL